MTLTVYHEIQRRDDPYNYTPSVVGNAIFLFAFLICTVSHSAKMFRHRSWYFSALVFGGLLEIIGYGARIEGHHDPNSVPAFAIQAVFLLIPPACFAATIYMTLGRIMRFLHCEDASPIRSTRITKVFVAGDVISFIAQAGGGGLMAETSNSVRSTGQNIVLIGLFVQIVFFGAFVILSAIVHRNINRKASQRSLELDWKTHLTVLYIVSVLIFVRCIFRVVEFIQGFSGWLISHEWTLFTFDGTLMVLVLVVLYFKHPSSLLREKEGNVDVSEVSLSSRPRGTE